MDYTDKLALDYIMPGQAQKHVTVNEALRKLDILVQANVIDWNIETPPQDPLNGNSYIIGDTPDGAWSDKANNLVTYSDNAWVYLVPQKGWCVWLCSQNHHIIFNGQNWEAAVTTGSASDETQPRLGINAQADDTNRLSVQSDSVLLSHDENGSGDIYIKANKTAANKTTSLLFQSAWTGHAEFGLMGDNDFRIKTSADGSQWVDALHIDNTTGMVTLPQTPDMPLDIELNADNANAPAFAMRGTALSGSSDSNDGVGFYLNHNAPNNRQFGLMTTDTQTGVRIIALTNTPILEGVKNGNRADLVIGSGTHGAHVGFTLQNTQFSVSNWGGAVTKTVFEVNGATNQSGDLLSVGTLPASRGDAFRIGADKSSHLGGPLQLARFDKAALPSSLPGGMIYVNDATGGSVPAYADGTNWRRMTDGSVID